LFRVGRVDRPHTIDDQLIIETRGVGKVCLECVQISFAEPLEFAARLPARHIAGKLHGLGGTFVEKKCGRIMHHRNARLLIFTPPAIGQLLLHDFASGRQQLSLHFGQLFLWHFILVARQ
jgi:hypothetical protein